MFRLPYRTFLHLTDSRLYLPGSINNVIGKGCRRRRWCSWEGIWKNRKLRIPDEWNMWVLLFAFTLCLCLSPSYSVILTCALEIECWTSLYSSNCHLYSEVLRYIEKISCISKICRVQPTAVSTHISHNILLTLWFRVMVIKETDTYSRSKATGCGCRASELLDQVMSDWLLATSLT